MVCFDEITVCGGEIEIKSHGIISTPGSPGTYPPNRDCIWKLTAPMNKRIHLHFFTLQLEAHENCEFDYLSVSHLKRLTFYFFNLMFENQCNFCLTQDSQWSIDRK